MTAFLEQRADPREERTGGTSRAGRVHRIGLLLAMVGLLLVTDPARALAGPEEPGPDSSAAVALLAEAARAHEWVSYSGTQFATAWTPGGATAALASVRHDPQTGTSYEVLGGKGAETVLDDLADDRLVDLMVRAYDVQLAGSGTVAGRAAKVVDLRRDDGSLAARVWTDAEACLLLRREVYDEAGTLVRAGGFIDLTVEGWDASSAAASTAAATSASPRASAAPRMPKGPRLPTRLGEHLLLYDVSRTRMGSATVTHLLYTDGMSSVSLFYQRGRLDDADLDGFSREVVDGTVVHVADDPPLRVTWDCYGYVYTLVADATATSMEAMLAVLPHSDEDDDPGLRDRVGAGLERVGGWLNPFG